MGKVNELTVMKGKTVKAGEREEWLRVEYTIKAVVEDEAELDVAKAHLEGVIDGWLGSISAPKPSQEKPTPSHRKTLDQVMNTFPQDLRELLAFSENSQAFIVKPKQFLGSENFAKIVAIVKDQGDQYVSKGKESHFSILK